MGGPIHGSMRYYFKFGWFYCTYHMYPDNDKTWRRYGLPINEMKNDFFVMSLSRTQAKDA